MKGTPMNFDLDHLAPHRDRQFVSIGYVCGLLQIMPAQLATLMEDCDIHFAQVVDGCGFLLVEDAERVAEKARDVYREISESRPPRSTSSPPRQAVTARRSWPGSTSSPTRVRR